MFTLNISVSIKAFFLILNYSCDYILTYYRPDIYLHFKCLVCFGLVSTYESYENQLANENGSSFFHYRKFRVFRKIDTLLIK